MAETAPLTMAHAHARKAAAALENTQHIQWDKAADEHQHAAEDFARTARSTSDAEALRILALLEEQHQKLAQIIRTQDAGNIDSSPTTERTKAEADIPQATPTAQVSNGAKADSAANPTTSAIAAARLNRQVRDSSPSLARDIASRRGIPQPARVQPASAAQARLRQLSPESQRRAKPKGSAIIPPSIVDSQAQLDRARKNIKKNEDDEGFAKFYSNITSGTMSKLNSYLSYAGLPLSGEEASKEPIVKQKPPRTVPASNEPDVNKIFSKAALNAIEESHRQQGSQGALFGPAESFYVVQPGGGTLSYADIAKAHQQQLAGIDEEDDEAFVDAREGPPSPRHSRTTSHQHRTSFGKPRTSEELELENTTLKTTLTELAGRLADFERHAMDANMEALNQSMLSMRGPVKDDVAATERLKLLEQQIEKQTEEQQRQDALLAKQREQLKKYHAKWEEIKSSARERRKGQSSTNAREKEKSGDETPNVDF